MIRTPLRPLARILDARQRGENPKEIERENTRLRTGGKQAVDTWRVFRLCVCYGWRSHGASGNIGTG